MQKNTEQDTFIKEVLSLIELVNRTSAKIHDDFLGLYNGDFMFGKVEDSQIFLLDKLDNFKKVDMKILELLCKTWVKNEKLLAADL